MHKPAGSRPTGPGLSPKDKPRVERQVQFVRGWFFAGETFIDLADAQRRAEGWCRERAGLRVHGTTQRRPIAVFTAEEAPRLLPAPTDVYDVLLATPKPGVTVSDAHDLPPPTPRSSRRRR